MESKRDFYNQLLDALSLAKLLFFLFGKESNVAANSLTKSSAVFSFERVQYN
jgi:hypothetical protein